MGDPQGVASISYVCAMGERGAMPRIRPSADLANLPHGFASLWMLHAWTPLLRASSMKITVLGLSHSGCVVAAGCSRYFDVAGLDADSELVDGLRNGRSPYPEPGLADLLATNRAARRLDFTTNTILACLNADIFWVLEDLERDDADSVLIRVRAILPNLSPGTLVLISSPLPTGSYETLWRQFPQFHFARAPLHLPPGSALERFENAARVVVEVRSNTREALLESLFAPFTRHVDFLATEDAESSGG